MLTPAPTARRTWAPFLPLLRPCRFQLCAAGTAMVLDALVSVARPWPLKIVIDRVLSQKPSRVPVLDAWLGRAPLTGMEILYGACATTLLIAVIAGLLTYYFTHAMGNVAQGFVFAIRRDLFAHMQRLSLRFHDRQRTGDLITRLTTDTQAVQEMIANGLTVLCVNAWPHWCNRCDCAGAMSLCHCLKHNISISLIMNNWMPNNALRCEPTLSRRFFQS